MRAGKLDRRVQFLRASSEDDGYQVRPGAYSAHGSIVWAHRHQISDGERFRADAVYRDVTARFTVRWSPFSAGITEQDRLTCDGQTFGIVGIKELGRRDWLEITASKVDP
ncbi:phage head closure protein [Paracoccus sp. (in: a-proteobacteria)]|uniref:phage head closure protein n=1 Tax=Paracoccus sp. TaxID=267 RepID=UPI00272DABA6|nr:phage head closure protein [Paracoccus sp. (in: a-proteobacteria)]